MSTPCITHTKQLVGRMACIGNPVLVLADGMVLAVCSNHLAADRIAELLGEHGIAEIPDVPT